MANAVAAVPATPLNMSVLPLTTSPCRLLELSGELRNKIYRLVVVVSDISNRIVVTPSGHERSALVRTCKQIHAETSHIYLYENFFRINVINYDCSAYLLFKDNIVASGSHKHRPPKDLVDWLKLNDQLRPTKPGEARLWHNLMGWLNRYHHDKQFGRSTTFTDYITDPSSVGEFALQVRKDIVKSMFTMVKELEGTEWWRAKRLLDLMRPCLARVESRFAESGPFC